MQDETQVIDEGSRSALDIECDLLAALNAQSEQWHDGEQIVESVQTFDDCGVLTRNRGLVLTLSNGNAFQITIVQSEYSDDESEG